MSKTFRQTLPDSNARDVARAMMVKGGKRPDWSLNRRNERLVRAGARFEPSLFTLAQCNRGWTMNPPRSADALANAD